MAGTGTAPGSFYGSHSANATPPQSIPDSVSGNGMMISLQDSHAAVCEKLDELLRDHEALWQEITAVKMQIGDIEGTLSVLGSRIATIAGESAVPSQKKRLPKALSVSGSFH